MSSVPRIVLKIGAIVLTVFIGVPVVLMVIVASSVLLYPMNFLQPIVSLIVFGLFIWAVVEVARRVGKAPKDTTTGISYVPASGGQLDEADLRLVLESKDDVGRLRMNVDELAGAPPSTQLLGLAAVADGLLNALPHAPGALVTARPLLVFYLPRIVAVAQQLSALEQGPREDAAERLGVSAALLGSALRDCSNAKFPDLKALDQATEAMDMRFGRAVRSSARAAG